MLALYNLLKCRESFVFLAAIVNNAVYLKKGKEIGNGRRKY